jgi:hypothetical protein
LQAVGQVVANQSQTDREAINRLRTIIDDPHLSQPRGVLPNSPDDPSPYTQETLTHNSTTSYLNEAPNGAGDR